MFLKLNCDTSGYGDIKIQGNSQKNYSLQEKGFNQCNGASIFLKFQKLNKMDA